MRVDERIYRKALGIHNTTAINKSQIRCSKNIVVGM